MEINNVSYILLLNVEKACSINVGSLGLVNILDGYYIYVGSARKGVFNRLARHFSKIKKLRWHIDYLTSNEYVNPELALILINIDEKDIAKVLSSRFDFVKGFGASDDRLNVSHLFYIGKFENYSDVLALLFNIFRF
jgi:Uri superfamily endonuclease